MFSHIMVGSNDVQQSKKFYDSLFGKEAAVDDKGRLAYRNKGAVFMVTSPIDGEPAWRVVLECNRTSDGVGRRHDPAPTLIVLRRSTSCLAIAPGIGA